MIACELPVTITRDFFTSSRAATFGSHFYHAVGQAQTNARAGALDSYVAALAGAEPIFATAEIAANAQSERDTATASATREAQIASLDAAYAQLKSQSFANVLATLGLATSNPFAQFALAEAQANSSYTSVNSAALTAFA
ncbi:MAG: hypothetical protein KDA38_09325, partial [Planctomycetales bacterium]|nr:hypothetical protein [Planctomycetales bacterium]